jgi:thiamine-phosphate pyrophosphorylase
MAGARTLKRNPVWANRAECRLPCLFLVTDERRLPDPLPAIARLPRGAGVIFRHYGDRERAATGARVARLARARRLVLLVAGDAGLAARLRADGVHLPERLAARARGLHRRRGSRWLVTAAAHSRPALVRAARAGADAALLSPVFATASHPGAPALGILRFAALARRAPLPVIALGGITARARRRLIAAGAAGIAGIGLFSGRD